MESHMTVVSGEFVTGSSEGVISLSKKIGIFNKILTKFGYTNIAIKNVQFIFKSRCAAQAVGTMRLRLVDRRLEDPDAQYIDGISFDVKDWINFSWAYPCWFHYKDFEAGDKDLIEIEWDVERSNMVENVSIGHYKIKITYAMQNDITVIRCSPNTAAKTHTQVHPNKFQKKNKTGRLYKSTEQMLDVSHSPLQGKGDDEYGSANRKKELIYKSVPSLFPKRTETSF
ncbi:4b protein [Trichosanthes associated rhabdovirus 1]|uniref:4b protein n=1 Tax=Trichosanthes associated rhabdovirus 1 TaxID=2654367 RepID=A0A6F9FAK7_9RHAB|nr:4b protein [Trichosanthes associated rhabdovirus 1]DAC81995.1 TPA_asm: 4b protein [Trichosanthes associated rhabdovirus 1]